MNNSNLPPWYLRSRFVIGLVIIFALTGLLTWQNANEQEDPYFPYRNGFVLLTSPGMNVDQLIDAGVKPVERALSQIDEIANVHARVKNGNATIDVELKESIYDTDTVWQRVKDRLGQLAPNLKNIRVSVQDRVQDAQGIFLSVDSKNGLLGDRRLALKVRDELLKLDVIRNVRLLGDPKEQLFINYSQQRMIESGVSPLQVAKALREANSSSATGTLQTSQFNASMASLTRLDTLDKIAQQQIAFESGQTARLDSLSDIQYRTDPLANERFWLGAKQTIGLGITLPPNQIQVTKAGEVIKAKIAELNTLYAPANIEIHLFQPKWTEERRDSLLNSLLLSCLAVAVILMCLMSFKSALVVSLSIPAIALTALGVFGMTGGVIHQMTIAGLVLSLGLMVDNSIVMAERIIHYLESGQQKWQAAKSAILELYKPLATATLTTIAAFVPMLLSKGSVADFIATIPVLVILCISISYVIAITFVPVLSKSLLKPAQGKSRIASFFSHTGQRIARFSLTNPKSTAVLTLIAIYGLTQIPGAQGEFFPKTSRNQAYVDIQLPFGSNADQTQNVALEVSETLNNMEEITKVLTFVGHSGPRFYYNLVQQPDESHIARVIFETTEDTDMQSFVSTLNNETFLNYDSILVTARELGQGPPVESPIEVRVIANQYNQKLIAAEQVRSLLASTSGVVNVRRDYALGNPEMTLKLDYAQLSLTNLTESTLSQYLAWRSNGLTITELDFTEEPIPLVIGDNSQEKTSQRLLNTVVLDNESNAYPISLLAEEDYQGAIPMMVRRNGFETMIIRADVSSGFDEESLLTQVMPELNKIADSQNVRIELGGEAEESSQANSALIVALPAGIVLLFIALILQFNSFKLSMLVMFSIPLGAIGAPAMLAIVGIPFGFMSILGVLALTGIVVNTAIILIESALNWLEKGVTRKEAIENAVQERFRPVILTSITTITGMLPLTSSASPLWPPLAWAVIGGLITSTALMMWVMPLALNQLLKTKP